MYPRRTAAHRFGLCLSPRADYKDTRTSVVGFTFVSLLCVAARLVKVSALIAFFLEAKARPSLINSAICDAPRAGELVLQEKLYAFRPRTLHERGYECEVAFSHVRPFLQVAWFQDSFVLDPTDRRTMEARGTKYTLTIKNVQSSDFGNYSCQGENNLGKSRKYMELSGEY